MKKTHRYLKENEIIQINDEWQYTDSYYGYPCDDAWEKIKQSLVGKKLISGVTIPTNWCIRRALIQYCERPACKDRKKSPLHNGKCWSCG